MTKYDTSTGSTGTILRLIYTYTQSQSGNYTNATVKLQLIASQHTGWANGVKAYVNIGGSANQKNFTYDFDFRSGSLTKTIGSYTLRINHHADGTHGSYSIEGHIDATGTSSAGGPTTITKNITPPRIPKPPSAVRSQSVSSVSYDRFKVSWTAPSDDGGESIDTYHVHVATNSSFSDYKMYSVGGGSRSLTATGLSKNTKYWVRTIAHNSVGWNTSYASYPVSTVTTLTTPNTPGAPSVGSATPTSLKVTWSAPGNGGLSIDEYQVQRDTSSSFSSPASATVSGTSYSSTGLAHGTRYYYRVRAHNAAGWSGWSGAGNGTTQAVAPSAPSQITPDGVTSSATRQRWSAPNNGGASIDEYQVQRSTSSSMSSPTTETTTGTSYTWSGLAYATTYYYRVRAHNSAGWGGYSSVISAKTKAVVPFAPTGGVIDQLTPTSLRYTFVPGGNGGASVDQWQVEYATSSSFSGAKTVTSSGTSTITGLTPGATYYVRARGHNSVGWGAYSATVHAQLPVSAPPVFSPTARPDGKGIKLNVSPPNGTSGVTKYGIQYRATGSSTVTSTTVTDGNAVITGFKPGYSYDIRASAYFGTYQTPWTDWVTLVEPKTMTNPGDFYDGNTPDTDDFTYQDSGDGTPTTITAYAPASWHVEVVSDLSIIDYPLWSMSDGAPGAGDFCAAMTVLEDTTEAGQVTVYSSYGPATLSEVTDHGLYAFSVYVEPSRAQGLALVAQWYDENKSPLGDPVMGDATAVTDTNDWTRITHQFESPDGAKYGTLGVTDADDGDVWSPWVAGDLLQVDGAMITLDKTLGYFDGDTPDDSQHVYSWTGSAHQSASVREAQPEGAFDPLADPDCPPPPAAPRPPAVVDQCIEDIDLWRRYWTIIPNEEVPLWLSLVPTVTIVSGNEPARQIRIRTHRNPDNIPPDQFGMGDWEAEQIVEYMPANTSLVLDGVSQRAWATVGDSTEALPADKLVYGTDGTPATWPLMSCGTPYLISYDVPIDAPDGNLTVTVSLTTRML